MKFCIPARCTESTVDKALADAGLHLSIMSTPTPGGRVIGWGYELRRPLLGGGGTRVRGGFRTPRDAAEWIAQADLSDYYDVLPFRC